MTAIGVFWWAASEADRLSTLTVLALPIAALAVVSFAMVRTVDESDGVMIRSVLFHAALAALAVAAWTHDLPRSTRIVLAESCLLSVHDGDEFDCAGWTGRVDAGPGYRRFDLDDASADIVLSDDTPTPSAASFAPTYRHLHGDWYLLAPWGAP